MYFEEFDKLPYDFPLKSDGSNEFVVVKDITKNIRFRKDFLDSLLLFEPYRITDGETPEIISEKLYGTPYYHWILMLANYKFDYIEDFPLSVNKLDIMIETKYGARKHDIRYYRTADGRIVQGAQVMNIENVYLDDEGAYLIDMIKPGDVIRKQTKIGYYTGHITGIDKDNLLVSVIMSNGGFKDKEIVSSYKYEENTDGDIVETFIGDFTINEIQYPVGIFPVTNYEYEIYENEKKRELRVIPKAYLDQILTEYSGLMQI